MSGDVALTKHELLMYLDLAQLKRTLAAELAGVSRGYFYKLMRRYRIKAPSPHAKLNPHKVREVRRFLGKLSGAEIGDMLGVHKNTVYRVANYETWYQVR